MLYLLCPSNLQCLPHCTLSRWPCFQIHRDHGSHRKDSSLHLTRCSHPPPATALRYSDFPAAVRKELSVLLAEILPFLSYTNLLSLSAPSFSSANKDAAISPVLPNTKNKTKQKRLHLNHLPACTPLLHKNRSHSLSRSHLLPFSLESPRLLRTLFIRITVNDRS